MIENVVARGEHKSTGLSIWTAKQPERSEGKGQEWPAVKSAGSSFGHAQRARRASARDGARPSNHRHADFQSRVSPPEALYFNVLPGRPLL